MALSQTDPNAVGDDYAIYTLTPTSIFPSLTFPNGANINTLAFSDLISPQSPGFTSSRGETIKSVEIDNASPCLLSFPYFGLLIQPFTTGYAQDVFPEQAMLWVQAVVPKSLATVTVAPISIRVYSQPQSQHSPGAGNSGIVDAVLADDSGLFLLSVLGSFNENAQPNGLYVANGYDFLNPDGVASGTGYVPARTPNVWVWYNPTFPAGASTATIYTPPVGNYVRLMCYSIGIDQAQSGDRAFLIDNQGNRLTPTNALQLQVPSAVNSPGFLLWQVLPANGRKLGLNAAIQVTAILGQAHTGDVILGLYVGP